MKAACPELTSAGSLMAEALGVPAIGHYYK